MSAAVHTALPAGRGYLTTEINVRFLRPVFQSTGEIMAEGRFVSCDGDRATAEGTIIDSRHVVHATATATCAVFRTRRHPRTDEGASEDPEGRTEVPAGRQSSDVDPHP
jgi:acyl-coenzyme A thioesterase PaaI-like protein